MSFDSVRRLPPNRIGDESPMGRDSPRTPRSARGPGWPRRPVPARWARSASIPRSPIVSSCGAPPRRASRAGPRATSSPSTVCSKSSRTRPEVGLAELHRAMVAAGGDPDLLFALAELSFLYGQATAKPEYHLAAAVYAYAFLFPEGPGWAPGGSTRACGSRRTSTTGRSRARSPRRTARRSSPGRRVHAALRADRGGLRSRRPTRRRSGAFRFTPTAELEVYGLAMRYRWPGLGVPLAASTRPVEPRNPAGIWWRRGSRSR